VWVVIAWDTSTSRLSREYSIEIGCEWILGSDFSHGIGIAFRRVGYAENKIGDLRGQSRQGICADIWSPWFVCQYTIIFFDYGLPTL